MLEVNSLKVEESKEYKNEPFIVFDNVSFSYNKHALNLDSVSFSVEKGETLGIIGVTGSGKTTIINLLLRLYDTDYGEIRIGGENIKSIPKEHLHSMFGVAFQNDFHYSATIEENVAFFRNSDAKKLDKSLKIAEACEFVKAL